MKKILGIIGIGLVAGTTIYLFFNKKNKRKKYIVDDKIKQENNLLNSDLSTTNYTSSLYDEFDDFKSSVASNVSIRHKEASNIMNEAVDNIFKRTQISEDENNNLDKISNELDELLSED